MEAQRIAKKVSIVGAGLVGSLLSIYLRRRGYEVSVYERRQDMRKGGAGAGRSINLALSNRGLRALAEVGLAEKIKEVAIPMHGRMTHDLKGNLNFIPYGKKGQYINSVSRSNLNMVLMNEAEKQGVKFYFNERCLSVDFDKTILRLQSHEGVHEEPADIIIGTDGAFSAVRLAMQMTDRFDFSQHYIEHGYQEFHIPPGKDSSFLLERNALHIWPRESFMMIALPNPDASFTCTLFYPFKGEQSFDRLNQENRITAFFAQQFPDAVKLMPTLEYDFSHNPISSLVTVKCFPWSKNNTMILGDAAHAIVPFYGQGMNAGFEDCHALNELLNVYNDDWEPVLAEFPRQRKPHADAVAQLALDNFIEMRDLVADPDFLLRKKIESKLHELYPDRWIPLYSMVTFQEDIGYADAYAIGQRQKQIMEEVLKQPGIEKNWELLNFEEIVNKISPRGRKEHRVYGNTFDQKK